MRQLVVVFTFFATLTAALSADNASVAGLITELAGETNKTAAAVQSASSGNEIVQLLDVWSQYFDQWKKKAKTAERSSGVKLLKAATPPPGVEKELQAFMSSVQALMNALQGKMELIKDDPQHGARIRRIVQKLKEI